MDVGDLNSGLHAYMVTLETTLQSCWHSSYTTLVLFLTSSLSLALKLGSNVLCASKSVSCHYTENFSSASQGWWWCTCFISQHGFLVPMFHLLLIDVYWDIFDNFDLPVFLSRSACFCFMSYKAKGSTAWFLWSQCIPLYGFVDSCCFSGPTVYAFI